MTRPVPEEVVPDAGGDDMGSDAINLKKLFKIPGLFLKPDPKKQRLFEMKGYRFFIPKHYEKNKTKPS